MTDLRRNEPSRDVATQLMDGLDDRGGPRCQMLPSSPRLLAISSKVYRPVPFVASFQCLAPYLEHR